MRDSSPSQCGTAHLLTTLLDNASALTSCDLSQSMSTAALGAHCQRSTCAASRAGECEARSSWSVLKSWTSSLLFASFLPIPHPIPHTLGPRSSVLGPRSSILDTKS
eukprot:1951365-Rhodomonas_salina.2